MKPVFAIVLALASIGLVQAQSPNWGLVFNLGVPMGDFREKIYETTIDLPVKQVEGYDIGAGGQLTVSFPLQKKLALRVGLGGLSTKGTNTASGYDTIYLRHSMFSLSGELQIFFDDARRHTGTYLTTGYSSDFERFERSFVDDWNYRYSEIDVTRKNRMGGTIGIGHTFYNQYGRNFTTELSYHVTFTNKDLNRREPYATDCLKISFGLVF